MNTEISDRMLRTIRKLDAEELIGWYETARVEKYRAMFPGEMAALHERARELGVKL